MNICPNCGKMAGLHGSVLPGCMCQYSMQAPVMRTEPVKIVQYNCLCGRTMKFESEHGVIAPQRTWQGLTDEDDIDWEEGGNLKDLVKAIEAKLKQKNGFAEEKNT